MDKRDKTNMVMATIKWVNDTFTPFGLKPIEDLPEAIPGQGNACVIAKVIKDGLPDLDNVHVGVTSVDLNAPNGRDITNPMLYEALDYQGTAYNEYAKNDILEVPEEVGDFIRHFDAGSFPELIDVENTICSIGECETFHTYKIGDTFMCPVCFDTKDNDIQQLDIVYQNTSVKDMLQDKAREEMERLYPEVNTGDNRYVRNVIKEVWDLDGFKEQRQREIDENREKYWAEREKEAQAWETKRLMVDKEVF